MITSFEVGSFFKIIDDGSPALRKIFQNVRAVNKALKETRAIIADITKALGAGLDPAIAETRALAAEWKAVSVEAQGARRSIASASAAGAIPGRRPRLPGGGGGGGGGGRGGAGGFHVSPLGAPLPGGGHIHYRGSGAAMAAAGTIGYGAYLAAEQQDAVWQMIFHSGLPNNEANRNRFSEIIKNAHAATGMPLADLNLAAIDEIRLLRGTPGSIAILPEMLRAAATEARAKGNGTTVDESMRALVGMAHMTKEYGVEGIKKLAPVFAFLSASNAATLPQIERAAGYAVPILQSGLNIDPLKTLLLGTALSRAGITNTKSGTWVRNMMMNSFPGTDIMSQTQFKHHEKALRDLGLIDRKNNPTFFTDGAPDPFKMMRIAAQHARQMSIVDRNADEKSLFGSQGYGAFAVLSDPKVFAQIMALKDEIPGYKARYGTFFDDYKAGSTAQSARVAYADFQNTLIDIGDKVLPPVNSALHDFDNLLKVLQNILPKGNGGKGSAWGKIGAAAIEGFGVGAFASLFTGPGALAVGSVTGLVSGGLKAGEIFLGLDGPSKKVEKFSGSVSQSGDAASKASSDFNSLLKSLQGFGSVPHMNFVPPAPASGGVEHHADIRLDGDKVGKVIMRRIASRARSPLEGSAYHDNTRLSPAQDTSLSMG